MAPSPPSLPFVKSSTPQSAIRTPQLEFFQEAPTDPNVAYLISVLESAGQAWTLAPELVAVVCAQTAVKWDTKKISHLAEASEGHIISGQLGYKLLRHATPEEVRHFLNMMSSKRDAINARLLKTQKLAHQIFG